MKQIIYMCVIYYVINLSNGEELPEELKAQMHEYALKLDKIRKSFESGKLDIESFGKLSGVNSHGKVEAIKKVEKLGKIGKINASNIDPQQIKEQFNDVTKTLQTLMKKLESNGFLIAKTLLGLDLFNIKRVLNKKNFNPKKMTDLVNSMDKTIKEVEEQLESGD